LRKLEDPTLLFNSNTVSGNGVFGIKLKDSFSLVSGQGRPFVLSTGGRLHCFGGDYMCNDNNVSNISKINFCGEPQVQKHKLPHLRSSYEMAFYGNDSWEDEYCFNTTSWD